MNLIDPAEHLRLLRLLDANANRASEGMRAVEDYVRFVLEDRGLAEQFKRLRHDFAALLDACLADSFQARDVPGDVGRTVEGPGEYVRESLPDVALANAKRVEQALRCLEEYVKLLDAGAARRFEALRYRAYGLHQSLEQVRAAQQQLGERRVQVLIDARESPEALETLARELVEAGAGVLQLREKRLDDRELLQRARVVRRVTLGTPTMFVMNDRVDLARAVEADGVHLGQEDLPVAEARRMLGPGKCIGVSTHNLEQAFTAVRDGANYLGCGPTFPSATKSFEAFAGLDFLSQVAQQIALPAFAIGGIGLENLDQVLAAGFHRVAVSHAVLAASKPGEVVRELNRRLLVNGSRSE